MKGRRIDWSRDNVLTTLSCCGCAIAALVVLGLVGWANEIGYDNARIAACEQQAALNGDRWRDDPKLGCVIERDGRWEQVTP